jgi:MoaA/NifB/PqqE/SkfB family radical SAM enzyme
VADYVQVGRALQTSVTVVVALPGPADSLPGIQVAEYSTEQSLRSLIEKSSAALVPGSLFETFPTLERTATRLVVDLSDRRGTSKRGLLVGDFFLCRTEGERESWLKALIETGRVPRRASRNGHLRRLIDILNGGPDWECAVDPLRLYCTSTLRQPRGWAWAPPSLGARMFRILREHGPRELVDRAVARVRRRLRSAPPGGRSTECTRRGHSLAAGLESADTLSEFHRILATENLVTSDHRFMDLEIDVSNKCNIRCRMCYFSFDEAFYAKPTFLTPSKFALLADAILPHAKTVMLSLGSEPLTSPHFRAILKLAAQHAVPELGFYTNGLLLDDKVIDSVIEHGVTLVAVSVDGATKQTYEAIRRGADFDTLLRNVRRLVRRRAASGRSHPRVRFGVVLMRQNIEELPDLVTLAWRLGVEELNFFHAVVYEGLDMAAQSLVHHKELSNRCLTRATEKAAELGLKVVHSPNLFDEASRATTRPSTPGRQMTPYCLFPFFHVSMDALGRVPACPFAHGEPPYGIVTSETPFEQIWLGAKFADLRRQILTNDPPNICRRCSFLASSHPDIADLFHTRPH